MLVFAIIAFCLFTGMVGFEIGFHFHSKDNKILREELSNSISREVRIMEDLRKVCSENSEWETRYNKLLREKGF